MSTETLTFEEMKQRYKDEWLLIRCQEANEDFELIRGTVE